MKKVAIVQSNDIPWKGYFDMIAAVDEFILYDDMQYTRRDWRNRNQIKMPRRSVMPGFATRCPIRRGLHGGASACRCGWACGKRTLGRSRRAYRMS